jgi:hypothetical protein
MGRTRDVSKILTSNTSILSLASASSIYQTIEKTGLVEITPLTISVTGGSGSISATGSVSFTSASAISLNNVFSSTYDNYRIIASNIITSSTLSSVTFRLRKAGTDNTSNIYYRQIIETDNTSISTNRVQDTSWRFTEQLSTAAGAVSVDIYNPFQASKFTTYTALDLQRAVTAPRIFIQGCTHNLNSSADFDGFTLTNGVGTMSGELSVYGYNK